MYFFYPETAGRTLEDIDRIFVGDTPLFIFRDKEAISEKRPDKFIEHEQTEIRRNSSVVPAHLQAAQRAVRNASYEKKDSDDYHHEDV